MDLGPAGAFCGQTYVAPVSKQHTGKQSVAVPPCVAGSTGTVKTFGYCADSILTISAVF